MVLKRNLTQNVNICLKRLRSFVGLICGAG